MPQEIQSKDPFIIYVRSATVLYKTYYVWKYDKSCNFQDRSMYLCKLRRDWELAAVFYRKQRRRKLLNMAALNGDWALIKLLSDPVR